MNAKQAKLYNNFKNTKCKLLRTNAAVWFNKMCKIKQVRPGYMHIKINGRRQQDKKTTNQTIRYRVNQEIKFLYRKKQHINQKLYNIHLECAQQYNGMWQYAQQKTNIHKQITYHHKPEQGEVCRLTCSNYARHKNGPLMMVGRLTETCWVFKSN